MNVSLLLLFLAGIFLVGFFGNMFFKKTKISDILLLIIIGYLIGPVFNVLPVSDQVIKDFVPFFGTLALVILLFEGGLHLNFYKVLKELNNSAIFTFLTFSLTLIFSAAFLYLFKFSILEGLLVGAILGGTSSAIVVSLIAKANVCEHTKIFLTLESAITDSLCVIFTIAILDIIIKQSMNVQNIAQSIISAFAIAALIGLVAGLFWLKILRDFVQVREYGYLLTLSFLFILYVLTEYLKGNGAFCALIFGLVLGNTSTILKIFKMKDFDIDKTILKFQSEIALFIKAFFFILLGVIIDFSNVNVKVVIIVIGLVILYILGRWFAVRLVSSKYIGKLFAKSDVLRKDRNHVIALHARGLAAAVLATYPFMLGLKSGNFLLITPIAFLIIFITNVTTTVGFFMVEKNKPKEENKEKTDEEVEENVKSII